MVTENGINNSAGKETKTEDYAAVILIYDNTYVTSLQTNIY